MITVLGLGFVGLTTALGFAEKGFKVYGFEINNQRFKEISNGIIPFHEPSLKEMLIKHNKNNFELSKDLKKIKGFDGEVDLSKYTLQKGVIHLENNNVEFNKLIKHRLYR